MKKSNRNFIAILLLLSSGRQALADVRLSALFADDMV